MIIGLTGKNAAGKGEIARFLEARGFQYRSLSDVLRRELKLRRLASTRDNLTQIGNDLREKHGPGVLADRILSQLTDGPHYVIDSFRNPAEVEVFRRRHDFLLWAVAASPKIRFARIKTRARENDPQTVTHFMAVEKREAKNADKHKQSIEACEKTADTRIVNNGTLASLVKRLAVLLRSALKKKLMRPDWDRYFMGIAQVVAHRSNCLKRRVAAIIVKNGRIISTGYNGTPRKTRNCYQGGCPRCNTIGPSGQNLSDCVCSHGEENAIVQAAYHGIAIKESTLYSTFSPCLLCTKMIINAGVDEVVFNQAYPLAGAALALLKEAGVTLRRIHL